MPAAARAAGAPHPTGRGPAPPPCLAPLWLRRLDDVDQVRAPAILAGRRGEPAAIVSIGPSLGGAGAARVADGRYHLPPVEPDAGGEHLVEPVRVQRLPDLGRHLGLPPPLQRPRPP